MTTVRGAALLVALLLACMADQAGLGASGFSATVPAPESTELTASGSPGTSVGELYRDVMPGRVEVRIAGLLRLVGSSRFPRLLVVSGSGEAFWLPSRMTIPQAWLALVGKQVEAWGWIEDHEVRQANGRVLGTERVLHARIVGEAGG